MTYRKAIIDLVPYEGRMVEVGTLEGDFAFEIATNRPDISLLCIDSWEGKFAHYKAKAIQRLSGLATVACSPSLAAAIKSPNGLFDMVYIDAAHDYKSVKEDIEAWWPKVRHGGVLAGRDFETRKDDGYWGPIEVEQAVTDWAKPKGLVINLTKEAAPSWWVRKA